MGRRAKKTKCSGLIRRLTGRTLRFLVIGAGFPYHKSPHLYQRIWVFILLPFLEEDTLNELSGKYGGGLRTLYRLLMRHPEAFERLLRMLAMPLFFELLRNFGISDATTRSRRRIRIIFDDTKAEKSGKYMEFIHKFFDNAKDRYIMGCNFVLMLAVSGDTVIPLSFVLWLPAEHPDHRPKNDIVRDEIMRLKKACDIRGCDLGEVELLFDSAYHVQKVMNAADAAGFRIVSKADNRHKFEFEEELLTPSEIIEKVAERQWKYLEKDHFYQRIKAHHHVYGEVVLILRRRRLSNGKTICDVLICNKSFYNAVRIHKCYKRRWKIEMHFKYYKQYLLLGKSGFRKIGSIRSHLSCVATAGLIAGLFRHQFPRKISFLTAVKLPRRELWDV
ncbi:transposase [Desulfonema magnum]|uniref:Transposase DDE domain-containing protein n=1 Tax=Desulfonema magnum TaxID=45655 RepID=A0A975BYF0_9BACT|nr:transposase [Desulfonema magnum]QTA93723.1 Transposase DDE domain-containing protein [Desulfonema magnum]QTA93938.1 Transposase DDE domain-containing protein [Desulfonema magnum]